MKRLLRRKLRKGACIALACYTLVLLVLVWPAGQKNFAKQLDDLDLSTSHQHGENASKKKKTQDTGNVLGDSSLLHQPPWKIPARRKLSKPDSQQVNVIVEDALPGTFLKKSSWAETVVDFEDLREVVPKHPPAPLQDRLRVSDPRSLDRILAGSSADDVTQTGKRTHHHGVDPTNDTVAEEEKEDSAAHGEEDDPEEHPRQQENWVAPDGAVESRVEIETDTLPAKSIKTNHHPQQEDTHGPSPKSATTPKPISSQVAPPVNRHAENFVEISDMVVYSAFCDTRLRGAPLVRMLAMGPVSRRPPVGYLWCVFGSASAEPVSVSVHQTGDCHKMRKYCFYMLHCRIPERLLKKNSSISSIMIVSSDTQDQPFSSRGSGERIHLTIITNNHNNHGDSVYRTQPPKPMSGARSANTNTTIHNVQSNASSPTATPSLSPSFAVCVPPIFGKITVLQIVEFIELNRLLGASHVVFYTFRVSREVSRVLSFYEEAGVVSVMPWNIPAPNDVWNKGQSIAMGDCLYRNMHIFDYILFSNMNEFFVPKRETSWQSFMETENSASKTRKTAVYEILPVKMYPNATVASFSSKSMGKSESFKFLTLRNTLRGQPLGDNSTRLIVKPERVLEVKSEFLARPVSEEFVSQKVDVHVATVYQFTQKLCSSLNSEVGSISQNCNELFEDRTFWRYKDSLLERSKHALRTLNRQVGSQLT